jgi:hypothetical protein
LLKGEVPLVTSTWFGGSSLSPCSFANFASSFRFKIILLVVLVRTMTAAALAAATTSSQKRGRENQEAILKIVVEPFLQFRVLAGRLFGVSFRVG